MTDKCHARVSRGQAILDLFGMAQILPALRVVRAGVRVGRIAQFVYVRRIPQQAAVSGCELLVGPVERFADTGDIDGAIAKQGLIVIAPDNQQIRQRQQQIQRRYRIGTVADAITQTGEVCHATFVRMRDAGLQGFNVAVKVRNDRLQHVSPLRPITP